jgi:hypothetical protein
MSRKLFHWGQLVLRVDIKKPAVDCLARAEPNFSMMPFCQCFARRVKLF